MLKDNCEFHCILHSSSSEICSWPAPFYCMAMMAALAQIPQYLHLSKCSTLLAVFRRHFTDCHDFGFLCVHRLRSLHSSLALWCKLCRPSKLSAHRSMVAIRLEGERWSHILCLELCILDVDDTFSLHNEVIISKYFSKEVAGTQNMHFFIPLGPLCHGFALQRVASSGGQFYEYLLNHSDSISLLC